MSKFYLAEGLPIPTAEPNGLSKPYWDGLREGKLIVQRNPRTGKHQFPPQWIAQDDHGFELDWVEVEPKGLIYSWTRPWHAIHPALKEQGPYIVVVIELPHVNNLRMLGNLLGDPRQEVRIGSEVRAVFEHHNDAKPPFSLAQWQLL